MRMFGQVEKLLAPDGGAGASAAVSPGGTSSPPSGASSGTPSSPQSGIVSTTPSKDSSSGSSQSTPVGSLPPETPSVDSREDPFDFGAFLDGTQEGVISTEPTPPPVATPPPAQPAGQTPAGSQQEGGERQRTTQQAPAGQQEPPRAETPPVLSPAEPLRIAEQLLANESQLTDHVAQTLFALSKEDVEALESNAVDVIPRLLARGYIKSQHNLLMQLGKVVPAMIQRANQVTTQRTQSEDRFYARWKDSGLDKAKHREVVDRIARTYRATYPQASFEQMVEDVGPMAIMAAKIAPPSGANGRQPAQRGAARGPQPPPFVPAVGAGPAGNATLDEGADEPWMMLDPSRHPD